MVDDFLIKTPQGLYCRYGNFYLDPKLPVAHAVVSHAHGDHARPNNLHVYCTLPTRKIMQLRLQKKAAANFAVHTYHQTFKLEEVELTFLPAGHILGSAMVKMEYQGSVYLFTGDYKLQPDETCEKIEFVNADVLITETTFANPAIQHPNPVEEIQKLNHIDDHVLMGVYGLGKAQRISNLIHQYCPHKKIFLHYSIYPIHQLYQQEGMPVGNFYHYQRKDFKQNTKDYIYMVPPLTFESYRHATGVVKMFASGWESLQKGNDTKLYISDHVDWNDILTTIATVKPKEVWTIHGDGNHLKTYFQNQLIVKIL